MQKTLTDGDKCLFCFGKRKIADRNMPGQGDSVRRGTVCGDGVQQDDIFTVSFVVNEYLSPRGNELNLGPMFAQYDWAAYLSPRGDELQRHPTSGGIYTRLGYLSPRGDELQLPYQALQTLPADEYLSPRGDELQRKRQEAGGTDDVASVPAWG